MSRSRSLRRAVGIAVTSLVTVVGLVATPGTAVATGGDPDFGPNVLIYDPATPAATIQAKLDALHDQQADAQFSDNRYAVLFKPGQYNVNANLGYYETVAGLGLSPDDTNITGAVRVTGYPDPSLGTIMADGREYFQRAPWVLTLSGVAISIALLGLNLLSDGIRDVMDPKLRARL